MGKRGPRMTNEAIRRLDQIVAQYAAGAILEEVGDHFDLSRERVRQLIVLYEKRTGRRVERHKPNPMGPPKAPRQIWRCEICKTERALTPAALARRKQTKYPNRCGKCSQMNIPRIVGWIAQYRRSHVWYRVARQAGYNSDRAHRVPAQVYHYLRQIGDTATLAEFWPNGVPDWILRFYSRKQTSTRAKVASNDRKRPRTRQPRRVDPTGRSVSRQPSRHHAG